MEEPFGAFEVEAEQPVRSGSFARGALVALPLALAAWLAVYLLL